MAYNINKLKKNDFFSSHIDWRRTLAISVIAGLVLFIVGYLSWYAIAILPLERHLLESQRLHEVLTKIYNARIASSTSYIK